MTSIRDLARILLNHYDGDHQSAIDACKRIESHEPRPGVAADLILAAARIERLQDKKERKK